MQDFAGTGQVMLIDRVRLAIWIQYRSLKTTLASPYFAMYAFRKMVDRCHLLNNILTRMKNVLQAFVHIQKSPREYLA